MVETLEGRYVPPAGHTPNRVLLVGEAPGKLEAIRGAPFVGPAGREQEWYLGRHGLSAYKWRRTNVVPIFHEGNPDPSREEVALWGEVLRQEVRDCEPQVIVAVGAFAARWFLGEGARMESCHGRVFHAGALDPDRADRARSGIRDALVMPVYHPAAGLHSAEMKPTIAGDYEALSRVVKSLMRGGKAPEPVEDALKGREQYTRVGGSALAEALDEAFNQGLSVVGVDTEGTPGAPWSIQVSIKPGQAYILKCSEPDFLVGISVLQSLADHGVLFVLHNLMYDIAVCRAMGLDLSTPGIQLWDTMYASFLLRLEPQALKNLAWRYCGMVMDTYRNVVGQAATERQVDYLGQVLEYAEDWPPVEPRAEVGNDGSARVRKPWSAERRAIRMLVTWAEAGGVDGGGDESDEDDGGGAEGVDLRKRWLSMEDDIRGPVEAFLGPFPYPTLADVEEGKAMHYAGQDADATLRLYPPLLAALEKWDLVGLMNDGMEVVPVFEEMQATGLVASRERFEKMTDETVQKMVSLQSRISSRYYGGKPFNPGSQPQVRALLRRRGLRGAKRTKKTREVSTSEGSIEHLRDDPAIDAVMEWRTEQKILTTFCQPTLDRMPEGVDLWPVRCRLKPTRIHTRRLAASEPNLLQIPHHVRQCYVSPPGQLYGAWDLSQIEVRYAAHLARDRVLMKILRDGRDVHAETAAEIFGILACDVEELEHRTPAKRATFGILYGIGGQGLATQLRVLGCKGWTVDRCEELIENWLDLYKDIAEAIKQAGLLAARQGFIRDEWGMYRFLPQAGAGGSEGAEAARIAFNHLIQGGAQGMIQNSTRWLRPRVWKLQQEGRDIWWCLQVHDELMLLFAEKEWDVLDPLITEGLTAHHGVKGFRVPVLSEGNKGTDWSKLK